MSTKYGKIINHPDQEQIISKLASGESVRSVANWLKSKYPDNKKYHIAFQTLDEFRKNFLNIKGGVLEDLKQKYKEQQGWEEYEDTEAIVKKNKTYNHLKKEALKKHIDVEDRMFEMLNVMDSRIEHLYSMVLKNPNNYKPDYVLLQYFGKILDFIKEIRRANGQPDQIIQHNVTVQAIDQQAAIMQQAIQEAISELDLETGSIVMEKIVSKIEKLKYKETATIFDDKQEKKIDLLEAEFLQEKDDDD